MVFGWVLYIGRGVAKYLLPSWEAKSNVYFSLALSRDICFLLYVIHESVVALVGRWNALFFNVCPCELLRLCWCFRSRMMFLCQSLWTYIRWYCVILRVFLFGTDIPRQPEVVSAGRCLRLFFVSPALRLQNDLCTATEQKKAGIMEGSSRIHALRSTGACCSLLPWEKRRHETGGF